MDNAVIARVHRLKTLTVDVKAGLATRHYKVVQGQRISIHEGAYCKGKVNIKRNG